MKAVIQHANINVADMPRAIAFYQKALGLEVVSEKPAQDGSFRLVFLGDGVSGFQLELTWLRDHPQAYELGENESHIAFGVENMQEARKLHEEMGCVCFVNEAMGIYFIEDPDGYWMEIVPRN